MLAYPQDNARDVRDVLIEQQQDEIVRLTKQRDYLIGALREVAMLVPYPHHSLILINRVLANVENSK